MTAKSKILAVTGIIGVTALLGATAIRAQKAEIHSPDAFQTLVLEGPNHTWLGVESKDVTSDQVRDLKLGGEYGAFVDKVEDDSPAAKAGIQAGDVIVQFAGERVRSVAELHRLVSETPAGRNVEIKVWRTGAEKTLNAAIQARNEGGEPLLGELRDQVWPRINVPVYDFSFNFGGPRLGLTVDPLTKQLGDYFGVKDGKGVLVREVNPGSAADKAGVKAGDCITKLDSTPIESANELHRALLRNQGEGREGRDVTLTIVRDRKEQTLKVHLEPAHRPGADSNESGLAELIDAQKLAEEARDLAPYEQDLAQESETLRNQIEAEAGNLQDYTAAAKAQAEEAQKQARELQKQLLDQRGQWQQEMKQLEPQMKDFQKQMKELRDSLARDVI